MIMILAALTLCLSGCSKFKDIKVNSLDIESISPQGMRGLSVVIAAEVDNPAVFISLSEINGCVKHSGKIIGRLTMDPFSLNARSIETYHLKARLGIDEDVSLYDLMMLTDVRTLDECTVDFSVKGTLKGGLSKTIKRTDIPLKELLDQANHEKN